MGIKVIPGQGAGHAGMSRTALGLQEIDAGSSKAQASQQPYWMTPSQKGQTPHPADDEFDSAIFDPAWQWWYQPTGEIVAPTREAVSLFGAPPPVGAVRMTADVEHGGLQSWLRLQISPSTGGYFYLTKHYVLQVGEWLWCRIAPGPAHNQVAAGGPGCAQSALMIMDSTDGKPSFSNYMYLQTPQFMDSPAFRFRTVQDGNTWMQSATTMFPTVCYFAIYRLDDSRFYNFFFDDAGRVESIESNPDGPVYSGNAMDRIGFRFYPSIRATPSYDVMRADFIRVSSVCPF